MSDKLLAIGVMVLAVALQSAEVFWGAALVLVCLVASNKASKGA